MRKVLCEEGACEQRIEEVGLSKARVFQAEGTASPKVLRWNQAGQVESQLIQGLLEEMNSENEWGQITDGPVGHGEASAHIHHVRGGARSFCTGDWYDLT